MALEVIIRPSTDEDVEAMLAIYRHHIAHGVNPDEARGSEAMQPDDLKRRRKEMRKHRLPHLVADLRGAVVGYAYAVLFRKRPAYRFTVKHSIYVHHDHLHAGIGRALLQALIGACEAAGSRQMIGYIDAANAASLRLHETYGFKQVAYLPKVGYQFTRWTDVVMVQRSLGAGGEAPPDARSPAAGGED